MCCKREEPPYFKYLFKTKLLVILRNKQENPVFFRTCAKEAAIGLTVLVLQEGFISKRWPGF